LVAGGFDSRDGLRHRGVEDFNAGDYGARLFTDGGEQLEDLGGIGGGEPHGEFELQEDDADGVFDVVAGDADSGVEGLCVERHVARGGW